MLIIYGSLMPLRMLEEIRFWKLYEVEALLLIRKLTPSLEPTYAHLLTEWESVLNQTGSTAEKYIDHLLSTTKLISSSSHMKIENLKNQALNQSEQYVDHLIRILGQSKEIKKQEEINDVIEYAVRGSQYFQGIFHALSKSTNENPRYFQQSDHQSQSEIAQINMHSGGTWSEPLAKRPVPIGGHALPPLPYAYDALAPHIDQKTMKLHHTKHHQSYVDGLNKAEKMMEQAREKDDFSLIKHWEREAAFHGAGHYLHTIFWNVMSPEGGGKATGPIAAQINKDFVSFDKFKAHFSKAAEQVEGVGWAILVWSPRSHRLEILQAEKHQNLSQWDVIPLLVLDVFEHAYYLSYQNERDKYIEAWWNVVNWSHVNERFTEARMLKWTPYYIG